MGKEYKDMTLKDFADYARNSSAELGSLGNGAMINYESGEMSDMAGDEATAIFLASAREMVLELVGRLRKIEAQDCLPTMNPVTQTKFGAEEGNCFAACIASLMGISIDYVPDFSSVKDKQNHDVHWLQAVDAWLWDKGLRMQIALPEYYPLDCYYLAWGKSPRGLEHSVIYYNGEMRHDPHPDGTGLVTVVDIAYFVQRFTKPKDKA